MIAVGSGLSFNLFYFICAIFLGSCLFSSIGLIIAAKSITLNDFILNTIPAQLVINIPALAYLFGWRPAWLLIHPGVSMIELLTDGSYKWLALFILLLFNLLAYYLTRKVVSNMFLSLGGVKL